MILPFLVQVVQLRAHVEEVQTELGGAKERVQVGVALTLCVCVYVCGHRV